MNNLGKPDLKDGVPLSCIPEVGHRRCMRRKLQLQSTAVCAVVIMIATCRGLALDPSQPASSYLRKNFTIEDGLPANEVHAILQTQHGFLWVGTEAGLARFDGQRFTPTNSGRGVAPHFASIIPHDMISRIEESSDGPNAPFHAEPARAASRVVSWPAMCRAKTTKLEEVRW
jgi:hypothetical protein